MSGEHEARKPASRRFSPGRLVPIAILAAGLAAYFALDIGHYLSPEALCEYRGHLKAWVEGYGTVAPIGYVIVYILVIAFSLPGGAVMTIAGGFLFGVAFGAVLTVIGATIGATVLFLIARFALADYLVPGRCLRQSNDLQKSVRNGAQAARRGRAALTSTR